MNPWLQLWTSPQETTARLLEAGAAMVTPLAAFSGAVVAVIVGLAVISIPGAEFLLQGQAALTIAIDLAGGALLGVLFIYILAAAIAAFGALGFVGGEGNAASIRIALAWALGVFHFWVALIGGVAAVSLWLTSEDDLSPQETSIGLLIPLLFVWIALWALKGFDMLCLCLAKAQNIPRNRATRGLVLAAVFAAPPFAAAAAALPFAAALAS